MIKLLLNFTLCIFRHILIQIKTTAGCTPYWSSHYRSIWTHCDDGNLINSRLKPVYMLIFMLPLDSRGITVTKTEEEQNEEHNFWKTLIQQCHFYSHNTQKRSAPLRPFLLRVNFTGEILSPTIRYQQLY